MKSIIIRNYKAFNDAEIEIKPLTIILGANSSGKSSLLQLFLMLEQTLNSIDEDELLRLNGHYVNLGNIENIFKDQNPNNILELKFELDINQFIESVSDQLRQLKHELNFMTLYFELDQDISNEIAVVHELLKDTPTDELKGVNRVFPRRLPSFQMSGKELKSYFLNAISSLHLYNALLDLPYRDKKLYVSYKYRQGKTREIILEDHSILIDNKILLIYSPYKTPSVGSQLLDKEFLLKLKGMDEKLKFAYEGLKVKQYGDFSRSDFIYNLFYFAYNQIERFFVINQVNYVGPLRAYPQRYYFLDGTHGHNIMSGEGIARILKKNPSVRESVNEWLRKFGLEVNVFNINDIIHNIKVFQNNVSLDITDVGFGISQVLPIMVQGFLSRRRSTTIIEQPEIHLHPKMQAELTDLFIQILGVSRNQKNRIQKRLIIETHSEYLLKRLRRRIAEGVISSEDVAVYFVEPRTPEIDHASLKKVQVDSNGSIDWPRDFYITEIEDDIAFFKSKMKLNE